MPAQDTTKIKEKIIEILRIRGPSLPVHIAKEIQQSILFTSAFLSELLSERKIKMSNLRVGSSPLYLLSGYESRLEQFSDYLKSKEKEAFILLKEKKFLKDFELEPAIKIAIRNIRDFAIPFKEKEQIYWRYFKTPPEEFNISAQEEPKIEEEIKEDIPEMTDKIDIFDEPEKKITKKSPVKKKKTQKKRDNKFFSKVKEFLNKRGIEISDIESFSKKEAVLRVKEESGEKLIVAYNKRRITEEDIISAGKKAQELNIPYEIICLGTPLKKLESLISAVKNLSSIETL